MIKSLKNKTKILKRISYLLILIIVLIGIVTPFLLKNLKQNWKYEVNRKVEYIESNTIVELEKIQKNLLENLIDTKYNLRSIKNNLTTQRIIESLYENNGSASIEVYDDSLQIIGWRGKVVSDSLDYLTEQFDFGETYFCETNLITYYSVTDTLKIATNKFYIVYSIPLEKKYSLNNKHYNEISLIKSFEEKFKTKFEINFHPEAKHSKDGRFYSFDILNNFNNKIAAISFQKPGREDSLQQLTARFSDIQAILAICLLVIICVIVFSKIFHLNSSFAKLTIYFIFLGLFRYALFFLKLPTKYISGNLTNASYFSSKFGWGIVKSPLELFITILFLLTFCLLCITAIKKFIEENKNGVSSNKYIRIGVVIFSTALFLVALRGFGASIKSVIFDSTVLYFKDSLLVPESHVLIMQLNVFLMGLCSVIISVLCLNFIFVFFKGLGKKDFNKIFITVFVFVQFCGAAYDFFQEQPQGTPLIRIVFITAIFLLIYTFYFLNKKTISRFIFYSFTASFISVALLNFYNSDLERESLKITATEMTRPNESWLEFLVHETLLNSFSRSESVKAFTNQDYNYDAAAFKIWSNSTLQKEGANAKIDLFDLEYNRLGGFGFKFGLANENSVGNFNTANSIEDIIIQHESIDGNRNLIRGIFPVQDDYAKLGYIQVSLLYDVAFDGQSIPAFLETKNSYKNSIVDFEKLKIFDFKDGELLNSWGNINLSNNDEDELLNAKFTSFNEDWKILNVNAEDYLFYILKDERGEAERVVAVGLKLKDFSFNLFNFFKVFFIHSIIISITFIFFLLINFKSIKYFYFSFRKQLLFSLLIISLIPLILLAAYFKNLTDEKNETAIHYKLGKRAQSVERYVNTYAHGSLLNLDAIFDKATKDLNINFTIYENGGMIYSSNEAYFNVGLLPNIINAKVYNEINFKGLNEFVLNAKIENYSYAEFYYSTFIAGRWVIIEVSELFNPILVPITETELNILLFGSYSLAIILIIVFSTILANQISLPIRRLTNATKLIAGGDLSVEVPVEKRGEFKELTSGFNQMVKELSKSQNEIAELERETAWKEMAKQVAHEIKNPLTPMKLSLQHLMTAYRDKSSKLDVIFLKVTGTLIKQIETLKNIASEFSNFARMPKVKLEKVNLNTIVKDVKELFSEEIQNINYNSETDEVQIYSDFDQTKRTIINLVRNSIQANANIIDIMIYKNENKVELRISDNGKGIKESDLDKVFENNYTTKTEGMGLGLSMAKKFLESTHAKIEIEKSDENGTTILITYS